MVPAKEARPNHKQGREWEGSAGRGLHMSGPCSLWSYKHAHTQQEARGYRSRLRAGRGNVLWFKKN